MGEGEVMVHLKRKRKKHKGQVEAVVGLAPSPSRPAPATTESKPLPPVPFDQSPAPSTAPETPILEEEAAAAARRKERKRKKRKGQVEAVVGVAPSPSRPAPATTESKPLPPVPFDQSPAPSAAPETPVLEEEAAAAARRKERKRKKRKEKQEQMAAPSRPSPPSAAQATILEEEDEDAVMATKKKKRKRRKHVEEGEEQMPSSPSPGAAAGIPILEEETATRRKKRKRKRDKEKQEQTDTSPQTPTRLPSGQSPLPFDSGRSDQTHCAQLKGNLTPAPTPPPPEEEQDKPYVPKGKSVKRINNKNPRVLSTREIIKMRIELRKQQQPPEGFVAAMTMCSNPNSICIEQNPNHSSPFGAFFDQFCYKPVHRPHPRGHPSSESSQLTANGTSKASTVNTSISSMKKQPGSGSAPGSREKVGVKEKEKPEKKTRIKKQRKPPPLLTRAEKCSDKYRRLPLDQLVPPPRSPYKLLQEKYASDPWKVIVICMLLNLTQGKQVRKKIKGFFKLYPDAQTAFNADPEKMAMYLAPLGLQRVKANRIQNFSKAYVEKEWTYITELCGVGKYAADAYAIFCAGRATEVMPEDHKLVDYWKYVCFELPTVQGSRRWRRAFPFRIPAPLPSPQALSLQAPAWERLERLRVLEIVGAPLRDSAVKYTVAACPNLTDLSLLGCDCSGVVSIELSLLERCRLDFLGAGNCSPRPASSHSRSRASPGSLCVVATASAASQSPSAPEGVQGQWTLGSFQIWNIFRCAASSGAGPRSARCCNARAR